MTSSPQDPTVGGDNDGHAHQMVTKSDASLAVNSPFSPPAPMWLDGAPGEEGLDFGAFLHSIRRKWLPGLLVGSVLASMLGGLLWLIIPVSFEAVGLVRVRRSVQELIGKPKSHDAREYDVFKATQAQLLKSPYVLNAAIRKPGIQQLSMIQEQAPNEIGWLESQIQTDYPGDSEIMVVKMSGPHSPQVKQIVDAVIDAYLDEIAHSDRTDKTTQLETLRREEREYTRMIKDKSETVHRLAEELGTQDSEAAALRERIEIDNLRTITSRRMQVANTLEELQAQLLAINVASDSNRFFRPNPYDIEEILEQDKAYLIAKENKDIVEQQMMAASSYVRPGTGPMVQMQQQMAMVQQDYEKRRKELIPRAEHKLKKLLGMDEASGTAQILQAQLVYRQRQLEALNQQYKVQLDKLASIRSFSSDLLTRRTELLSLRKTAVEIANKTAELDLQLSQQPRVLKVQPATIPNAGSLWIKLIQVFVVTALSLFGTMFSFAFFDYRAKRLNRQVDIESACSLSVIGAMPALRGGGLLSGRASEAEIADSVDSLRTSIMYGGSGKPINSVVITSAVGHEGKSTVASQLAVSLARAGRRTLLVDGDVKNPQQHAVFGLPLDRGFCDVLRGDAQLEEVIQATPAEGLWILPAGRCDLQALHALSGQGVGGVVERLIAQFDFVVIDSGPVLTGPEAMIYGQHVDAAVISTRKDVSRLPKVDEASKRLQAVGVRVLGSVINGTQPETRRSQLAISAN